MFVSLVYARCAHEQCHMVTERRWCSVWVNRATPRASLLLMQRWIRPRKPSSNCLPWISRGVVVTAAVCPHHWNPRHYAPINVMPHYPLPAHLGGNHQGIDRKTTPHMRAFDILRTIRICNKYGSGPRGGRTD